MNPLDENWRAKAACKGMDTDLFVPETGHVGIYKEARLVCARCEVRTECLEYALASQEPYGMWGGLTPKERLQLWRARRRKERR